MSAVATPPPPAAPAAPPTPPAAPSMTDRIGKFADGGTQNADATRTTKPAEVKTEPPKPSTSTEPSKTAPVADKPATEPVGDFPDEYAAGKMRAGELSRHYKKLRKDYLALKDSVSKQVSDPKELPEFKKLSETLTQREQRIKELDDEMRFTRFEGSSEYKQEYEKPYLDAYANGRTKTAGLKVREIKDPVTEEVTQAARQATPEDFDRIMEAMDDNVAAEIAEQLFGPAKSAVVITARERAFELNQKRLTALEDYRKQGGEREAARLEQTKQEREKLTSLFHTNSQAAIEKFPDWFKPEENDAVGNDLLTKGFEYADSVFTGMVKDEAGNAKRLSPQEKAHRDSVVRNKAAGFDRMAHRVKTLRQKNADLEKKIAELTASDPGDGDAQRRTAAAEADDATVEGRLKKYAT